MSIGYYTELQNTDGSPFNMHDLKLLHSKSWNGMAISDTNSQLWAMSYNCFRSWPAHRHPGSGASWRQLLSYVMLLNSSTSETC